MSIISQAKEKFEKKHSEAAAVVISDEIQKIKRLEAELAMRKDRFAVLERCFEQFPDAADEIVKNVVMCEYFSFQEAGCVDQVITLVEKKTGKKLWEGGQTE